MFYRKKELLKYLSLIKKIEKIKFKNILFYMEPENRTSYIYIIQYICTLLYFIINYNLAMSNAD